MPCSLSSLKGSFCGLSSISLCWVGSETLLAFFVLNGSRLLFFFLSKFKNLEQFWIYKNRMKEPLERENRLASYISYTVFISKIYEELVQSSARTLITPKWAEGVNRRFSRDDTRRPDRCMKKCSVASVVREMSVTTSESSPHTCQNGCSQQATG